MMLTWKNQVESRAVPVIIIIIIIIIQFSLVSAWRIALSWHKETGAELKKASFSWCDSPFKIASCVAILIIMKWILNQFDSFYHVHYGATTVNSFGNLNELNQSTAIMDLVDAILQLWISVIRSINPTLNDTY